MHIIGLGHYSRTGKDTFANYLLDHLARLGVNARKMPFAWKLKQICHDLYAWDGLREPEFYETPEGEKFRDIPLPTIGKTPVQLWVDMGTPAVRQNVYEDTWIDFVLRGDHGVDVLVVPDCRFVNECAAIKGAGGTIIKVVRPGFGPRPTVADRALVGWDGWDFVFGGSGRLSELSDRAYQLAASIASGSEIVQFAEDRKAAMRVEKITPWTPPSGWQIPAWYPMEAIAA